MFWSSDLVDRSYDRLYVRTIPLSGCMYRRYCYSMDQWDGMWNVLSLLLSCQTIQLFNDYGVEIFHHYKYYDNNINFEWVMTEEEFRSNFKLSVSYFKGSYVNVDCKARKLDWQITYKVHFLENWTLQTLHKCFTTPELRGLRFKMVHFCKYYSTQFLVLGAHGAQQRTQRTGVPQRSKTQH